MKADVYYNKSDHLTRIMTGLHLLQEQQLLHCQYFEDTQHSVIPAGAALLEMQIAGKRIAFDLSDASGLKQPHIRKYLSSVDMYFERSHQDWHSYPDLAEQLHKIHPFGFNYFTTYPNNPAYESSQSGSAIKKLIRNIVNTSRHTNVEAFEGKANYSGKKKPKIIFMTRLWDPDSVRITADTPESDRLHRLMRIEERKKINSERIEICRQLKRIYGDSFCGGIQRSSFSISQCPDIVLPVRMTLKSRYLTLMKNSDICIGSAGLEKSIGWKTGEYVAAARAIVCEEPAYLLPGNFAQGINYLSYNDVDSCLEAVDKLYHNPDLIYQMQLANEIYYKQYLRPEKQILNALRTSGISI